MKKIFAVILALLLVAPAMAQQTTTLTPPPGQRTTFVPQNGNAQFDFTIASGMNQHMVAFAVPASVSAITVTVQARTAAGSFSTVGSSTTLGDQIKWTGTYAAGRIIYTGVVGSGAITADYYGAVSVASSGVGSDVNVTNSSIAITSASALAVTAATLPLPSGAATAAKQPALGTAGSSATDVISVQGIASGTALPVSGTVTVTDGSGALNTIVDSGTLTAVTSITNPVTVTDGAGALNVIVDSSALPSLASTSTKQSDGSQKTQIVDGSGNVIASTSNNLNVQCANCSGSGASATDEASFTTGTSTFAPVGGFFQTTATSNALTTGQQGLAQMTAQRALFANLRNASGTEVGTSTTPLQVSLANTGTNSTAVAISAASLPLPSAAATSTKQSDGTQKTQLVDGSGNVIGSTTNALDVNIKSGAGSGGTALADGATFTASTTSETPIGGFYEASPTTCTTGKSCAVGLTTNRELKVNTTGTVTGSGTFDQNLKQINGTTTDSNSGTKSAGTIRVVIATDQPALTNKLLVTPDSVALPANQSVNVSQINGVTPLMGAGNTGTGSQRATIATDQAALPGLAIYTEDAAETAAGNLAMSGTVRRDAAASSAGTTGDNATLNTDASGLLWVRQLDPCSGAVKTYFPINIATATTTQIAAAVASQYYYVCAINLFSAGTQNFVIVEDDTAACASPTAGLNGGTTAATGYNLTAQTGVAQGNGNGSIMRTAAQNRYICIITSAAVQVSGQIVVVAAP